MIDHVMASYVLYPTGYILMYLKAAVIISWRRFFSLYPFQMHHTERT